MPKEKKIQSDGTQDGPIPEIEAIDAVMQEWADAYCAALDAADRELAKKSKPTFGDGKQSCSDSKPEAGAKISSSKK